MPKSENLPVRRELFEQTPAIVVEEASNVANVLKDVIDKQGFAVKVGGGEHVKIEGWTALGTMLGIMPRETNVEECSDGSFAAQVELYSVKTGSVVGRGSGYCGMDEPRWSNKPKYARRSMAITRATGRAYRSGLGWVVSLAGYKPTPAEEMQDLNVAPQPQAAQPQPAEQTPTVQPASNVFTGTSEQEKMVAGVLERKRIPEKYWDLIRTKMHGKPGSELEAVVVAVMAES